MAGLFDILIESFHLLLEEPRLFAPRLLSAGLSSVWILGVVSRELNIVIAAITLPLIGFVGVFVSVMVAAMVKYRGEDRLLKKGFQESIGEWGSIIAASISILVAGFVISLPLSLGLYLYYVTGALTPFLIGAVATLTVLLLLSFVSYFLPISIYEEEGFVSGFKGSMSTSNQNRKDVAALTLFSFAMLGLAAYAGRTLEVLGAVGFLMGRLVSSVVGTYLFVISPKYYLEE